LTLLQIILFLLGVGVVLAAQIGGEVFDTAGQIDLIPVFLR